MTDLIADLVYVVVLGANGDIYSVNGWHDHDGMDAQLIALGAIRISKADVDQIGGQPKLWRYQNGALTPRPPDLQEMAATIRQQRDLLLRGSDWTTVSDAPLSDADKAAWRVYRQALRDLPEQDGFPQAASWPAPPARGTPQ